MECSMFARQQLSLSRRLWVRAVAGGCVESSMSVDSLVYMNGAKVGHNEPERRNDNVTWRRRETPQTARNGRVRDWVGGKRRWALVWELHEKNVIFLRHSCSRSVRCVGTNEQHSAHVSCFRTRCLFKEVKIILIAMKAPLVGCEWWSQFEIHFSISGKAFHSHFTVIFVSTATLNFNSCFSLFLSLSTDAEVRKES